MKIILFWRRYPFIILAGILGLFGTTKGGIDQFTVNPKALCTNPMAALNNHVLANWETYKTLTKDFYKTPSALTQALFKHVQNGAKLYQNPEKLENQINKLTTKNEWKNLFADLCWFFYTYQTIFSVSIKGPEAYSILFTNKTRREALSKVLKYLSTKTLPGEKEPIIKRASDQEVKSLGKNFLPYYETEALFSFSQYYPERYSLYSFFGKEKPKTAPIILPNGDRSIVFKQVKNSGIILMRPEPRGLRDTLKKIDRTFSLIGGPTNIHPLLDAREVLPQEIYQTLSSRLKNVDKPLREIAQNDIESKETEKIIEAIALPGDELLQIGCEIHDSQAQLSLFASIVQDKVDLPELSKFCDHRAKTVKAKITNLPDLAATIKGTIPLADDAKTYFQDILFGNDEPFLDASVIITKKITTKTLSEEDMELISIEDEITYKEKKAEDQETIEHEEDNNKSAALSDDDDQETLYESDYESDEEELTTPEAQEKIGKLLESGRSDHFYYQSKYENPQASSIQLSHGDSVMDPAKEFGSAYTHAFD